MDTIRSRRAVFGLIFTLLLSVVSAGADAAQYAAMVMDARSGKVLHSRNADTRLHPASLTKMMTLYVVFDAIEKGELSLDQKIKISRKAAAEPPSKLGLRAGQRIELRYLIRAAAIKSANDAATALGEAVSGSEAAFARRMNRMAKAMGMTRTTFKNAHGLTEKGHLSTARDMTTLGRHLFYDFPDYYNLFSRRSTHAGIKAVNNTNRRLLNAYRGADGIKTGYTRAAGYNLVASAERGQERIIATVFGGRSTATRNKRVAELLDMGFSRAPSRVAVVKPRRPVLGAPAAGKTIRTTGLITKSPRPQIRPGTRMPDASTLVAMQDGIADALTEAAAATAVETTIVATPEVAQPKPSETQLALATHRPVPRKIVPMGSAQPKDVVVVARQDTGDGRWSIGVGRFPSRHEAEKALLQTALTELSTLDEALRSVVKSPKGFEARFTGLSEQTADLACRRLEARNLDCEAMGPG